MTSEAKTSLVIVALLVVVIGASFLYSRTVRVPQSEVSRQGSLDGAAPGVRVPMSPVIAEGQKAMRENRLDDALEQFESVLPSDPTYAVALQHIGLVKGRRGDLDAAVEAFEQVAALQPESAEAHAQLAWARYRVGRPREAEFAALRALELEPKHAGARFGVGLYRLAQSRLPEAVEAYHRAIEITGDRIAASQAMTDLRRLHESSPDMPGVHYALAFFASTLAMPDLEREELEHFLALEPEGALAANARGRLARIRAASPAP